MISKDHILVKDIYCRYQKKILILFLRRIWPKISKICCFLKHILLIVQNKRGLCFNALKTLFVCVGIPTTQVMREAAVKICTFHRSILPLATTNWDLLSSGGALLNIKVWDEKYSAKAEWIWVNLSKAEQCWAMLSNAEQCWAMLSRNPLHNKTLRTPKILKDFEKRFLELPRTTSGS